MKKVVSIGRHASTGLVEAGFEVAEQINLTFSTDPIEALSQLGEVAHRAAEQGLDGVLLQNVPGPLGAGLLAAAIFKEPELAVGPGRLAQALRGFIVDGWLGIGVVISRPGPRPAGVEKAFNLWENSEADAVIDAVTFANPRAKVKKECCPDGKDYVRVTVAVDPPMPFVLEHVVWIDGSGLRLYNRENPA